MSREVWLTPNVASRDFLRMFQHPEEWEEARRQITCLEFIQWAITQVPNPQGGPNNAANFLACVPGGAFRWLRDHGIDIAIEGGAVKEYSCGDDRHRTVDAMLETLDIIHNSGGVVKYIEMDEPHVAAMLPVPQGCGYTGEQVAHETKLFIDAIHERYPEVQIGLVSAYPAASAVALVGYLADFQRAGIQLPFYHLDIDYYRVKREHSRLDRDLPAIQSAARAAGCRFGAVVWGEDGSSNEAYCRDARALASAIDRTIGFGQQDNLVFMSWSTNGPQLSGQGEKTQPDNLPESDANTHTGLLMSTLTQYGALGPKEEH